MDATPPQPDPAATKPPARRVHHVPPGTGTLGMVLLLISLTIVFASSMLAFLIIRITTLEPRVNEFTGVVEREAAPPLGSIDMPAMLWLSTAIILISSFTMHRAVDNVRHERQTRFRSMLTWTLILAVAFLVVQAPSLAWLLREHWQHKQRNILLYGVAFFLILLHALHVLGGIIPLGVIHHRANNDGYDHENYAPVRYMGMYWHFLDGVWLVMFTVLLVAG
jgi:heme/copper-type cytochrome/quinol oxidase subunit 3